MVTLTGMTLCAMDARYFQDQTHLSQAIVMSNMLGTLLVISMFVIIALDILDESNYIYK